MRCCASARERPAGAAAASLKRNVSLAVILGMGGRQPVCALRARPTSRRSRRVHRTPTSFPLHHGRKRQRRATSTTLAR